MPKLVVAVRWEVYEELRRRAQARGVSLYEYVRRIFEDHARSGDGYAEPEVDVASRAGLDLQVLLGKLEEVAARLERLEESLARVERSLPPVPQPSGKPNIPEPTPENLRRIAAKLEQREIWPDEYPGNLTAGEILLLDRLVKEGRAYYDHSTRRWRIRDLQ